MPRAPRTTRPNQKDERRASDLYRTPEATVATLLPYLPRLGRPRYTNILDPCAGDGVFQDVLGAAAAWWTNIDIRPDAGARCLEVGDFLTIPPRQGDEIDLIVSNPPFSLAEAFIRRAHAWAPTHIIFLLRLNFLGSRKRAASLWRDLPPTNVIVIPARPIFQGYTTSDAQEYAWFVWSRSSHRLPGPQLQWCEVP